MSLRSSTGGVTRPSGADAERDPVEVAREICLQLLTARPRTRAELAQALRRRRVSADVSDEVLGRLGEVGLVDDAAFATAWVSSRHRGRGLGRRALSAELRKRGVDPATVADAVDTLDGADEIAAARALVRRRLPATAGLPVHVRMRRLVAMLARKGYDAGLAAGVVKDALASEGADVDEAVPVIGPDDC